MIRSFLVSLLFFMCISAYAQHNFMHDLYDQMHDSPLQQKFKTIKPMPTGVVYMQRPGEGEKEIRQHFRMMKELGFNCLKQVQAIPGWTNQQLEQLALEEGIIPWWYGEGGWEPVTEDLLKKLGIPRKADMETIRRHPKMLKYQHDLMAERIKRTDERVKSGKKDWDIAGRSVAYEPELGGRGTDLSPKGKELFVEWVKNEYKTIDKLNHAWNQNHVYLQPSNYVPFASWEDFDKRWHLINNKEYRHLRDILRFKVEHGLESIKNTIDEFYAFDQNHVFRGGGELSLFLPQAHMGVDLESIAGLMKDYGSFYPSIHFAWHFFPNDYELTRPYYMQSSLANDFFKGGWAATWESTGGPQQFSGGKGGAGFTVDEGVMTQFILSQIAGGFKGFGLWAWNVRTAGWEAGEYGLLDRHNQLTPRAVKVGKIAQAMQKYRDEIWEAKKEPVVGILYDWENEATWAAMSEQGRDHFRMEPIYARIGISRALMNANIPFEYVTFNDLKKGLGPRYQVIYLPQQLSIGNELMGLLTKYVEQGGRLVADMPLGWFNEYSALLYSHKGSPFEKLFGTTINDFQYSGVNITHSIDDFTLDGFVINQTPSTAKVLANYDNGLAAITENSLGKGKAIALGYQASMMCFKPGNDKAEKKLLNYVLGGISSPYAAEGALVYRLASPAADHYFVINEGAAKPIQLSTNLRYKRIFDAVTGEELKMGDPIQLDRNSGRWLRFEK
ncbi:MAG: beta-galactosidase trimerization domain-containing protein [Cyclobacteriaceae bacterium]|nr:beta-galactosidase trimerization domain-containing protein [Cyclobacteriaceae bacterium]